MKLFGYLSRTSEPLRHAGTSTATPESLGLPDFYPPGFLVHSPALLPRSCADPPIEEREPIGNFFLSEKDTGGREFTSEDEETLVIFASQAAMVIANARRYNRDEQRARRPTWKTLVSTSPIGVLVILNATTGAIRYPVNRESTHRIVGGLLETPATRWRGTPRGALSLPPRRWHVRPPCNDFPLDEGVERSPRRSALRRLSS